MKRIFISKRVPNIGRLGKINKENLSPYFLLMMFACGLAAGAVVIMTERFSDNYFINNTLQNTVEMMVSGNNPKLFKDMLISSSVFVLSTFPWAMCCVGLPALCVIPVFRGIGYSALGTYLIKEYSMEGLRLYCLSVVPGAVISVLALIFACSSAITMSKNVYMGLTGKYKPDRLSVKNYLIRLSIFVGISAVGNLINLICCACFKDLLVLV